MRILVSADLHGHHDVYEWLIGRVENDKPDALVLAGDLLGSPKGYESRLEGQRADAEQVLRHVSRVSIPVFYFMGNYDLIELPPGPNHLRALHGRRIEFGAFNLVGYQYTPPFVGGPFEKPEEDMAADLARFDTLMDTQTVLVTHGPARGILDRTHSDVNVGSTALREFIDRVPYRVHVHGHVHERFGRDGVHLNVASAGKKRAMLLDLQTLEHEVIEEL